MLGVNARVFAAGALVLAAGGSAFGQLQFNFTYQRLSGAYNPATPTPDGLGQFSATAVDIPTQIQSEGVVSRNVAPGGAANFLTGFTSQAGSSAGFVLDLSVFGINGIANTASGNGTFVAKDVFGNAITGTISGNNLIDPTSGWTQIGSFLSYTGTLTNVVYTPVNPPNFTGSDGSSYPFGDFIGRQFTGAIITLSVVSSGGFFNGPFGYNGQPGSAVPTQVNGQLVPAPASMALLGLAGIVAGRRRRS